MYDGHQRGDLRGQHKFEYKPTSEKENVAQEETYVFLAATVFA